jgi:hypothetical protein
VIIYIKHYLYSCTTRSSFYFAKNGAYHTHRQQYLAYVQSVETVRRVVVAGTVWEELYCVTNRMYSYITTMSGYGRAPDTIYYPPHSLPISTHLAPPPGPNNATLTGDTALYSSSTVLLFYSSGISTSPRAAISFFNSSTRSAN